MRFSPLKKVSVFLSLLILSACSNDIQATTVQLASLDANTNVSASGLFGDNADKNYPKVHPKYYNQKYPVIVMAHRGYADVAPENTMASFRKAYQIGANMIELDVHLSKDGQLVVMHDSTVDRTTNGKGTVKSKTVDELKQLDAGAKYSVVFKGEKIPTLEEVFAFAKDKISVNIEIKSEAVEDNPKPGLGIEEKLVNMIKKYNLEEHVIVSGFSATTLKRVKALDAKIPTGLIIVTDGLFRSSVGLAASAKADSVHEYRKFLSKSEIEKSHEYGLHENPWTVDDPHRMRELVDRGVDGLITDRPDLALKVLAEKYPTL